MEFGPCPKPLKSKSGKKKSAAPRCKALLSQAKWCNNCAQNHARDERTKRACKGKFASPPALSSAPALFPAPALSPAPEIHRRAQPPSKGLFNGTSYPHQTPHPKNPICMRKKFLPPFCSFVRDPPPPPSLPFVRSFVNPSLPPSLNSESVQ
jgi:hypothetical protein